MSTQPTGRDLAPMTDLSGRDSLIPMDPNNINYDEAARVRGSIDHAAVDSIAESIRATGQVQPITCVAMGDRYVLLDGLHRLLACKKLGITVETKRLTSTWFEDDKELFAAAVRMMEVDSIILRAEVTPAMRDRLWAERIELYDKIAQFKESIYGGAAVGRANGPPNKRAIGPPNKKKPSGNAEGARWFTDTYTALHIPKKTAQNRWGEYIKSTGGKSIPPSRANQQHKDGFKAYLKGNAAVAEEKTKEAEQAAIEAALAKCAKTIKAALADCIEVVGAKHPALQDMLIDAADNLTDKGKP